MDNDRRIGREEYLCIIIRSMLAVVAILKSGPLRLLLVPKTQAKVVFLIPEELSSLARS